MPLPPDFQNSLVAKLKERGIIPQCELCGNNDWAVLNMSVSLHLSDMSGKYSIPPPQVPTGGLVCSKCGNVRLFALGALGLLAEKKENDKP